MLPTKLRRTEAGSMIDLLLSEFGGHRTWCRVSRDTGESRGEPDSIGGEGNLWSSSSADCEVIAGPATFVTTGLCDERGRISAVPMEIALLRFELLESIRSRTSSKQ